MDKRLKVYRNGLGIFVLDSYQENGDQRMVISYSSDDGTRLEKDDCIMFTQDKDAGRADRLLVVDEITDSQTIVRIPGDELFHHFREFEKGQEFTIISTFREEK